MVEMSREQSFQVLCGSASQRNESDHGVFPVVFPDTGSGGEIPETSHLSLQANSASSEQPVKRKRGRPRKIKPEDHGDDATMPDQQPEASVKRGRPGRPKRSEQTTKQAEPPLGDGEASVPVKRGRGRPRKIATQTESQLQLQQHLTTQPSGSQAVSSDGVASHTSTTTYNTVQQLAQNAAIVSVINIQGTPVQVLPTTAVTTMNMIDSNSPLALRPAVPVSVVVSPTRDDATEWTTMRRTTPPPRTANKSVSLERRACGTSLAYKLQGASSSPLLHAEQPKVLNLLPQCSLSSSEVSVKLVNRLAKLEESDGHGALEEVRHDTRYLKQQGELDASETKRKGAQMEDTSESTQVSSSGKPDMKTQGQTTKVKPQPEQALVKRKRGRPPKNRNPAPPSDAPQLSTITQKEPINRKDTNSSMPPGESMGKAEPSVAAAVAATEQPVVKRKPGHPPKVKTQNPPSESPSLPPRAATTITVNGEENKPITPRRGRPPKSTKTKVQTAEASGEVKVKRGRGRPRKYPIPVVAASGPFLPSVSGIMLPATGQREEGTPTQGVAPLPQVKSKQQSGQEESSHDSQATVATSPVKRKRGRPPKHPDGPPPAKRKPSRLRIHPIPDLSPQRRDCPPKVNPEPPPYLSPGKRGRNPTPDLSLRKRGRPPKANPDPPDLSPRQLISSWPNVFSQWPVHLEQAIPELIRSYSENWKVMSSTMMSQLGEKLTDPFPSPATVVVSQVKCMQGRSPKHPAGPSSTQRKPSRPRIHPILDFSSPKHGHLRSNRTPDLSPRKRGHSRTNPELPDLSPRKRGHLKKHLPDIEAIPPQKHRYTRRNPPPEAVLSQVQQQTEQQEALMINVGSCCHKSAYFSEAEEEAQVPFLHHHLLECDDQGQEYTIKDHDITLRVPERAVAKGEKVHFEIGVAMYGPFMFLENVQPISPIIWLCILEDVQLKKPFKLILPHFLTDLSQEQLHCYEIEFAKADHTFAEAQTRYYKFNRHESEPLFASSGSRSYGVLNTSHCCFYCLQANKTPKLARDAGYCLARIERLLSRRRSEVYFTVVYMLKTCVKALEEQFPLREGYRFHYDAFKFKTRKTAELHIKVVPSGKYEIALEPSAAKIKASAINFWRLGFDVMHLQHEKKMYPPRVKMTVILKNKEDAIVPVKFLGCSSDSQLDIDLPFPLYIDSDPSSSSISNGSLVEKQSHTIITTDDKPKLKDAFKFLYSLAGNWKAIGTLLGVEEHVLQCIEKDETGSPDCLRRMLSAWLKETFSPTWKDLADATETIDTSKAQEIRNYIADMP